MNAIDNKKVVIFESHKTRLTRINENELSQSGEKEYIFEGPCAEFGKKNSNHRWYDREDYIKNHLPYLEAQIVENSLCGALDHPEDDEDDEKDIFTPKMKDLALIVLKIWYNESLDQVWIRVKLLDTHWGKDAKACADAGMPIFISSRASGYIEDDGRVTLDTIHTFDIVYRPGFKAAKLLKVVENVESSYSSVSIFECNAINKSNKDQDMEKEYITKAAFEGFTDNINKKFIQVGEALDKILEKKINETQIDGENVVGGINKGSKINFIWVVDAENPNRVKLILCKGNGEKEMVISVGKTTKPVVNGFIFSYKTDDINQLVSDIKNNFEGNPLFESTDEGYDSLMKYDGDKESEDYEEAVVTTIAFDVNLTLDEKFALVEKFADYVLGDKEMIGGGDKQQIVDAFLTSYKDMYITEKKKSCVMENLKKAAKSFSYIKEQLDATPAEETPSLETIGLVKDFCILPEKSQDQKLELIGMISDLYDVKTVEEIVPAEAIEEFVEKVSTPENTEDAVKKIYTEVEEIEQQGKDQANMILGKLDKMIDYMNSVAVTVNTVIDNADEGTKEDKALLDSLAVMESRINRITDYCNMIGSTVNNVIDYSSITSNRVNSVTDYSNMIAESLNATNNSIEKLNKKTIKEGTKNTKVAESLDSKIDKAIGLVLKGRPNKQVSSVFENKKMVFEDNQGLRVPMKYKSAWNVLDETKKDQIVSLFEYRNPKSKEEFDAIWESLSLSVGKVVNKGKSFTYNRVEENEFGYSLDDIDKSLGI